MGATICGERKILLDSDVTSGWNLEFEKRGIGMPTAVESDRSKRNQAGGYRVQEFAELAGVTVRTLHHYDRLGQLKPLRTHSGYRCYSEAHLAQLEQIVALKFIGVPLKRGVIRVSARMLGCCATVKSPAGTRGESPARKCRVRPAEIGVP